MIQVLTIQQHDTMLDGTTFKALHSTDTDNLVNIDREISTASVFSVFHRLPRNETASESYSLDVNHSKP